MSSTRNLKTRRRLLYLTIGYALLIFIAINGSTRSRATASTDLPKREELGITIRMIDQMTTLPGELGALPAQPAGYSRNASEVELGKMLFFDKRLSQDNSMSCSTCHDPAKGFADGNARATGFGGKQLDRHSPTVLNAAFNTAQFWDGRAATMEEQAQGPILAAAEMNMLSEKELIERLNRVSEYRNRFQAIYGQGPNLNSIAKAIAAFERTLVTPGSRFDQYAKGDKRALSEQEKRGLILFIGKASCSQCHNGINFTDNKFYNLGDTPSGILDLGRFNVTKDEKDKGAFKTPTLRNVALTAPYMHDGSLATLEDVIDFYDQGGGRGTNKSELVLKLDLSAQEKKDLIAFLKTLNGKLPQVSAPQLPKED